MFTLVNLEAKNLLIIMAGCKTSPGGMQRRAVLGHVGGGRGREAGVGR